MTRGNSHRWMAGLLLAAILFLPASSAAIQVSPERAACFARPAGTALERIWGFLAGLFPVPAPGSTTAGDNGWQIDPDGNSVPENPARPGSDNGWQIDPNGDSVPEAPARPASDNGWLIDPDG